MEKDMDRKFIWMQAESFIHVGIGQVAALVDLPFVRESVTGYPYIPGSGVKGALRDNARLIHPSEENGDNEIIREIFGEQDAAGSVLVSDAKLAFLPVRSSGHPYRLLTCPYLLERIVRDLEFSGVCTEEESKQNKDCLFKYSVIEDGQALCGLETSESSKHIFIEEFCFDLRTLDKECEYWALLERLKPDNVKLDQIAVVSNAIFDYFARTALHVRTRNKLDPKTKTVAKGMLWSEESMTPESVLYTILSPRNKTASDSLKELMKILQGGLCSYLQVGGNETVGEGWFKLSTYDLGEGDCSK